MHGLLVSISVRLVPVGVSKRIEKTRHCCAKHGVQFSGLADRVICLAQCDHNLKTEQYLVTELQRFLQVRVVHKARQDILFLQ